VRKKNSKKIRMIRKKKREEGLGLAFKIQICYNYNNYVHNQDERHHFFSTFEL